MLKTYGTIDFNNYTIEKYPASAEIQWTLVSSSNGMQITYPEFIPELSGSVIINRAKKEKDTSFNIDTGTYEHVLYFSIKHLFYTYGTFISASKMVTSSLAGLPDNFFVFSIGNDLYGNSIEPGTFEVTIHPQSSSIQDDSYGNLYVEQSGTKYYVGNIFYQRGIAVIQHNTGSSTTSIGTTGLKIIQGSVISVNYNSNSEIQRHEIFIKLKPTEFNFPIFNPSILRNYTATEEISTQLKNLNITEQNTNEWSLFDLLQSRVILPYVTTVGLYNDLEELVAVAKLSKPIQRTFDTEQIFIIRFDTE